MGVFKTNIHGNSNVGLYLFCNDKFCLVGKSVEDFKVAEIERAMKVPVHKITIAGTDLIGAFVAGNNNKIIVPELAYEHELRHLDSLGISYIVIRTDLTALGNNVLTNDTFAIVNPEFSAVVKKQIRQALNVKVVPGTLMQTDVVGSMGILKNECAILTENADKDELEKVETLLNQKAFLTTVGTHNQIGSSIVANSYGFVIGEDVRSDEILIIEDALSGRE